MNFCQFADRNFSVCNWSWRFRYGTKRGRVAAHMTAVHDGKSCGEHYVHSGDSCLSLRMRSELHRVRVADDLGPRKRQDSILKHGGAVPTRRYRIARANVARPTYRPLRRRRLRSGVGVGLIRVSGQYQCSRSLELPCV